MNSGARFRASIPRYVRGRRLAPPPAKELPTTVVTTRATGTAYHNAQEPRGVERSRLQGIRRGYRMNSGARFRASIPRYVRGRRLAPVPARGDFHYTTPPHAAEPQGPTIAARTRTLSQHLPACSRGYREPGTPLLGEGEGSKRCNHCLDPLPHPCAESPTGSSRLPKAGS